MAARNTASAPDKSGAGNAPADPMARYRTRNAANTGTKVFLIDPSTNEQTEDWIMVQSSMSDAFRIAKDLALTAAGEMAGRPNDEVKLKQLAAIKTRMHASLLTGWSFPLECNLDNAADFLADSPHVSAIVVGIADKAELFFRRASHG